MKKETKKIEITYDVLSSGVANPKLNCSYTDLIKVLTCGDNELFSVVINSMLKLYLCAENKEHFLSLFLLAASEATDHMNSFIDVSKFVS